MEFNRPTHIIPAPWAENGQYETIPATQVSSGRASWDTGFPLENTIPVSSGGIPANYQDFQGVLHDLSEHTCFRQTGGLYLWSSSIDYPIGAVVQGSDNGIYRALAKNGPNTTVVNPVTDSSGKWTSFVMTDGNQTISGTKTFSNGIIVSSGVNISGGGLVSLDGNISIKRSTTSGLSNLYFTENNGTATAMLRQVQETDSTPRLQIGERATSGTEVYTGPQIWLNRNGNIKIRATDSSGSNAKDLDMSNSNIVWGGKGFVYDSEDQTIAGTKTFSNTIHAPGIENPSGSTQIKVTYGGATKYLQLSSTSGRVTVNTDLVPTTNGNFLLGLSGNRWKEIWCTQNSINSSSDERIKQQITTIPDAVLDAWGDVDWIQFKYNDACEEKGADKARLHNGLIAQRVDATFKAHGLNAAQYGLFLYDQWDAEPEERDGDGTLIREARPAGDAYGLRYTEALCMEAAYQRRRADRAEARITALEQRLGELESVLASLISPISEEQTEAQEGEEAE